MKILGVSSPLKGLYVSSTIDERTGRIVLPSGSVEVTKGNGPVFVSSKSHAWGWESEFPPDFNSCGDIEIRIGVGPLLGPPPVRVIAHAKAIQLALLEIEKLTKKNFSLRIFSSAPKTLVDDPESARLATTLLALALESLGIPTAQKSLSLALPSREVSGDFELSEELQGWLDGRAERYVETARDDLNYGFEHAAPSMFGDLIPDDTLRITIGGANEARFWAIRCAVRKEMRKFGLFPCPAFAITFPGIKVPWYSPTRYEPRISAFYSFEKAVATLLGSANPNGIGGNPGLKREAVLFSSLRDFSLSEFYDLYSLANSKLLNVLQEKGWRLL